MKNLVANHRAQMVQVCLALAMKNHQISNVVDCINLGMPKSRNIGESTSRNAQEDYSPSSSHQPKRDAMDKLILDAECFKVNV